MKENLEELEFDYHREFYLRLYDGPNAETREYFEREALEAHVVAVQLALRKSQFSAVSAAGKLLDLQAVNYMVYGVARRLQMLGSAFQDILLAAPVGRQDTLSGEEAKELSRDLNTVYVNLRGAIDNLAWCLRHERGSEKIRNMPETSIGLFSKGFRKDPSFLTLDGRLAPFDAWFKELRKRRDPVAHRIPLYVPPAILDLQSSKKYQELETSINLALSKCEFERVDALREQQGRLGRFYPRFMHDPQDQHYPFYPTIPADIGQLLKIFALVVDIFDGSSADGVSRQG